MRPHLPLRANEMILARLIRQHYADIMQVFHYRFC